MKEPQPDEIPRLRAGQTLFTYLHLAASPGVAEALCDAGIVAIAYETIRSPDGSFPFTGSYLPAMKKYHQKKDGLSISCI